MMQIEDMTIEQIEQYLAERKAPKSKLGGTAKHAINMKPGETGWLEVVCDRVFEDGSGACFYPFCDPKLDFAVRPNHIVETNAPERQPARRRMTAVEAKALSVGTTVWVKAVVANDVHSAVSWRVGFIDGREVWVTPNNEVEVNDDAN
jgi:hypothetical protein